MVWIEGAGNRFVLHDALTGGPLLDPPALARALAGDERRPDGVLLLDRDDAARLRMTIWNRDGSRPEACGNGLRCVARHAVLAGHAPRGTTFEIATDAGLRRALVTDGDTRVSMGPGRVVARYGLDLDGERVAATEVDLGNPHLVLRRYALRDREVGDWGPRLERDPRFPRGTNVEFATLVDGALHARVWERGVGETAACGTGACAIALALASALPARVSLPGGVLEVDEESGELWLAGPVVVIASQGAR